MALLWKRLPVQKDSKDPKKVARVNYEYLDQEEKKLEAKMRSTSSTGEDRAVSKEIQQINARRKFVK